MHVVRPVRLLTSLTLLCLAALVGASGGHALAAPPQVAAVGSSTHPNVVLITADDMRADDLRYMPHTNRLLSVRGTTFGQALSNYPLCCPARATIVSGEYPHNNGVKGNAYPYGGHRVWYESGADKYALPVRLKNAGYQTAFVGKYLNYYGQPSGDQWGGGQTYVPPGWDDWNGIVGNAFKYYCNRLNQNGTVNWYPWQYQTDLLTTIGRASMQRMAGNDAPFFMWMSYVAPHGGFTPTDKGACSAQPGFDTPPAPRHVGMFDNLPLPPSQAFNEADMADKGTFMQDKEPVDVPAMESEHAARVASLQALDEAVRDLVVELRAQGVLDDTIIMFTSDNGYFLGEHKLTGKILPYEEALRIPFVVRGPGFPAGVRREQPVGLVDIASTATTVADAPADLAHPLDGLDLTGLAQDPTLMADRVMPIEAGPLLSYQKEYDPDPDWLYQGVRSAQHVYFSWHVGTEREEEFYDLVEDPFQLDSDTNPSSVLHKMRNLAPALDDCRGTDCVDILNQTVTPSRSMDPQGVGPVIGNVKAPKGWIRTDRPVVSYTVSDDSGGAVDVWCSQQAIGCGTGSTRFRLEGEGWQEWRILATDSDQNVGARTGRVAVDLYRPKALRRSPKYAVVGGRFPTRWEAADSGSGLRAVDVRTRRGALTGRLGLWQLPPKLQGRAGAVGRLTPPRRGGTVCAQLRAKDRVNRSTGWTGNLCRARAVDTTFTERKGSWRTLDRAAWFGGTADATRRKGDSLTLPTSGTLGVVELTARTGSQQGIVRVTVGDKVVRRINLSLRPRGLQSYRIQPGSSTGPVTVTVVSEDAPVWVDSLAAVRRPRAW